MSIICTDDIARQLGTDPSSDQLVGIADAVNAQIVTYLGFDPSAGADKVEFYDTVGGSLLALNHGPVVTASVVVNELGSQWWGWWNTTPGAYGQGATDPFTSDTLLVRGVDYAVKTDQGDLAATLVRLKSLWPVNATIPVDRLAGNISPARGCVRVAYTVSDSDVLAIAKRAALLESVTQFRSGRFGMGIVLGAGMDGASVTATAFQRRPGPTDARDSFLNPAVAPMLKPSRRTAYA